MRPATLAVSACSVAALLVALAGACVSPQDNPTNVHDMRVLGMSFEPPELFIAGSPLAGSAALLRDGGAGDPRAFLPFLAPVRFSALLAEPAGPVKEMDFELFACASQTDLNCPNQDDRVLLVSGRTDAGELVIRDLPNGELLRPGALMLDGGAPDAGRPLIFEVQKQDAYKGLGGIRMPLVLHLTSGSEEIFASKLLVFGFQYLPEMQANTNPHLPGLLLDGTEWPADTVPELHGIGPFKFAPLEFSDLEEPYVVPSFTLEPVSLVESWKLSWRADFGTFRNSTTGGTGLDGKTQGHKNEWKAGTEVDAGTERPVTFWVVVRDGRGGESWLTRHARWFR